ncbi:uncharacterized protein LOC113855650 [Abrus precatorius]|uniref:Uncharacterized protein LOC113855650 n=1 Tax=Abrus precatorius TaxID=3816 RepID=A0A8B8KGY8_ABRPR|nr:uncharacterized protein LOC113855650 [Abrus precatorius]
MLEITKSLRQQDLLLINKVKITLLSIQAVLTDAEEKQFSNATVKEWLDMVRGAVCDVEDLLDEINTSFTMPSQRRDEYQSETFIGKMRYFLESHFKYANTLNSLHLDSVKVALYIEGLLMGKITMISSPYCKQIYEKIAHIPTKFIDLKLVE